MAVLRGYFQGLNTMVPTAISQIIEQLVNAVVSIVGASILFGIGTRAGKKAGEELLGPAYGAARQYHRNRFRGTGRTSVSYICGLAVQGQYQETAETGPLQGKGKLFPYS